MLTTLCQLGEPTPFIFCFDQMEGLKSHSDDREGYFKMGQVLSDLHDNTRNVVLLPCLQTSELPKFEEAIQQADRDRIKRKAGLQPLNLAQAMKLVSARLDHVPDLQGQRPIHESDLQNLFKTDGLCVARKVIVHCQELFNRWLQTPHEPVVPLKLNLRQNTGTCSARLAKRMPKAFCASRCLRCSISKA